MKKKVLLTKNFFNTDLRFLRENLDQDCMLVVPEKYDEIELIEKAGDINVFLGGYVSKDLLKAAPKLELIQIPWTGVDKFNFDALKYTTAKVCNSHSNSTAVAEFSVALFLSLIKGIVVHDKLLRIGSWNRPLPNNDNLISPFSPLISSLTIGIMGFGAIGSKICELLRPFKCKFVLYNSSPIPIDIEKMVKRAFYKDEIDLFLSECDVLFVCLPLTDNTRQVLNKSTLRKLKKGAYLINTARGEIINEEDLYNALESNYLRGAAIDTWWKGPSKDAVMPSKYRFQDFENVVMSSHRAAMIENELPHLEDAVTNINNLINGLPLINEITSVKRY